MPRKKNPRSDAYRAILDRQQKRKYQASSVQCNPQHVHHDQGYGVSKAVTKAYKKKENKKTTKNTERTVGFTEKRKKKKKPRTGTSDGKVYGASEVRCCAIL